jgi:asparaginyl-tRNA synthetase
MNYIMDLVEDMVIYAMKKVVTECKDELRWFGSRINLPSKPFKRYTSHELHKKFGGDWEYKSSLAHKEPFWVTCHKREFYDREDPKRPGHYRNYDLIWPLGYGEALSGGEREWEYDRIIYRLRECNDVTRYKGFSCYLELARDGLLKPSAGGGLGIERFIRYLTGVPHIGDIQLFRRVPGEEIIF